MRIKTVFRIFAKHKFKLKRRATPISSSGNQSRGTNTEKTSLDKSKLRTKNLKIVQSTHCFFLALHVEVLKHMLHFFQETLTEVSRGFLQQQEKISKTPTYAVTITSVCYRRSNITWLVHRSNQHTEV